ncbi:MAG: CBS domain-containing protein [Bilophila wadsworthia]
MPDGFQAIAHELGDMPVSEYMQRTILTVPPDAPLQRLMKIIVGAHQRLVPVVEKNEVIGVVTRTDLINMFVEDPSGVPIPVNTSARERNLAKLLSTRLPQPMLHMLHRAGELGDRLQVSVYAVGGFVRDIMLSRLAVESTTSICGRRRRHRLCQALAQELGGRVCEHRTFDGLIIYHDENGEEQRLTATARPNTINTPPPCPPSSLPSK